MAEWAKFVIYIYHSLSSSLTALGLCTFHEFQNLVIAQLEGKMMLGTPSLNLPVLPISFLYSFFFFWSVLGFELKA
jgi:hypothetical protein